jgi:hypothetical protein
MVNEISEPRRVENYDVGKKNGRQWKEKKHQVQQQECSGQKDTVD